MKKRFTMLLASLFLVMGTAWAAVVDELQDKKIVAIGEAVSEITVDQWYLLYNNGRGGYVSEEDPNLKMRATSNCIVGDMVEDKAGYLFKITAGSAEGKYYVMSGNGLYFSLGNNSATISDTPVDYTFTSISSGIYYFTDVNSGYVANGQELGSAFVGWGTTAPGANGQYKLLPVTAEVPEADIVISEVNSVVADAWTTSTWTTLANVPAEAVTAVQGNGGNYASLASEALQGYSQTIKVPSEGGNLSVAFVFGGGSNRLDIAGVDWLDANGDVVYSDYHFGYSGGAKVNNIYTAYNVAAGIYTMRYWVVFGPESNTSNGNITIASWNIDTDKTYRLKNKISGLYMEVASFTQTSGEGALQLKNKSLNAGQLFTFGKGGEYTDGQYNLASKKDGTTYYVNASDWNFFAGTESTTPFTIAAVDGDGSEVAYSLYQSTAMAGYAGNVTTSATDGTKIYCNQGSLTGCTTWVLEEVDDAEFESALTDLLAEANALAGNAVLEGTSELTALNEAITAVNNLGATPELDALVNVVNNLQIVVPKAAIYVQQNDISYITALEYTENSNHPVLVNNARSNWGVADNATALNTLAQLGLSKSETDTKQQFAFITPDDGENYYLYSVHAQRYLKNDNTFAAQGEPVAFADASTQGANKVQVRFRDVAQRYFNVGGIKQMTIDWWSDVDEGNACEIVQYNALEFDLDYALKVFNEGAELTIKYMHDGEQLLLQNELLFVGDTKTIPCDWAYTTIESVTVDGVSVEAPAEGNDWTFTIDAVGPKEVKVNLVYNTPFALTVENDTTWHMLKIRPSSGKWVKRVDTAPYPDNTERPTDDNGLWAFTGNPIDGIQVLNKAAGEGYTLSFDATSTGSNVYMKEDTTTWTLEKAAGGFLLRHGTTGNKYVHDYGSNLKFWDSSSAPGDEGSALVAVSPLTIKYMLGGVELEDLRVEATDYAYGTEVTIANPYANKYIAIEGIETTGSLPELVDDKWSVTVTKETELTVTLVEDLPFKVSTNYDVVWHYMQMNSNGWKYVKSNHGNNTTSTTNTAQLDDASLWAFVGDALNGFKILNKAVGGDSVLYVASTNDGTAAYMSNEAEMKWTIEMGNGGFVIRQGTTECLNDYGGGGVMKIWNAAASPNGAGSAFQAIEYGLRDLSELANPMSIGIYTLQAERSPLLYSTTDGMTTKLSSGLVDGVAADEKDVNQHFLFLRTANVPEGYFYLYSVGAKMFVDAELNLTDFPEPVLSFESYTGENSTVYPWWVKIADKYVIPANGGTDGNKIHHTEGGDDDDGKRYRIVKVGTYTDYSVLTAIEQAEDMIKQVSELSNEKVYTVSTYDRGYWYYNTAADSALWSTNKAGVVDVSSSDANVQFAFLTVAEHTYIYSIGAQKFVIKKDGYTTYSDEPTQAIELLDAKGTKFYPFVAAFVNGENKHHIGISNSYAPPVITFYNDLNDGGNKIKLREVTSGYMAEGAADLLTAALAKIEDYLVAQELKPELLALIDEAQALLDKNYLDTEDTEALTNAKTTAQGVYDNDAVTSGQLTEQVELLTEAITAVTYVREVADFKNAYVYTFVSNRSATAYMMYDGETDYVASQYMKTGLAVGAEEANCQWAVYTSTRGYYYLYNLGAEKFMGTESAANTSIPFSATPQTTELIFKVSAVNTHPIMISTDGGAGVANHSNNAFDGKNQAGLLNWAGGFGYTSDGGNVHQVAIVGALAEGTLATIAEVVELFEGKYVAVQELGTTLTAFKNNYYDGWQSSAYKWRDQSGVNNYSLPSGSKTLEEYYNEAKAVYDASEESTLEQINEQLTILQDVSAILTINQPEDGKFYRLRCVDGQKRLQSTINSNNNRLTLDGNVNAESIFLYHEGALLSYTEGLYIDHRVFNNVGVSSAVTFSEATNGKRGCYIIKVGANYIYGAGDNLDSGTSVDQRDGYNWWLEEVTELPVTVGTVGYSTFYTPVAVTIPDTVTAYVISETLSNSVALEKVTGVVPAGTGLILEGEGDHTFAIATEGIPAEFDKGLLKGSAAKTLVTPEYGYTCYVLANGSEGVGLYKAALNRGADGNKVTEGGVGVSFLNNACKVYLSVDKTQAAPAMFSFRRGGDTTDIESSALEAQGSQLIYDLSGRRVLNPTKGMYIVNGKKVIIK